jgi:hypothetical protein
VPTSYPCGRFFLITLGAPYLHHKLAPVDRPVMRKLSEMSNEELEAAVQEAREELQKMTENEGAPVQDAVTKSVH